MVMKKNYQPDFRDENGVYYDPHAKYYWDEKYQHKIDEVMKNYPDKTFICFSEDKFETVCISIRNIYGCNIQA